MEEKQHAGAPETEGAEVMKSKIPAALILCALLIVIAGCGGGSGIDFNKMTATVPPAAVTIPGTWRNVRIHYALTQHTF